MFWYYFGLLPLLVWVEDMQLLTSPIFRFEGIFCSSRDHITETIFNSVQGSLSQLSIKSNSGFLCEEFMQSSPIRQTHRDRDRQISERERESTTNMLSHWKLKNPVHSYSSVGSKGGVPRGQRIWHRHAPLFWCLSVDRACSSKLNIPVFHATVQFVLILVIALS